MRSDFLRGPAARLWTVILAAGASSRLGRPKQLVRHRHRTLLCNISRVAAAASPDRVVVVLGAGRVRLLRHLRRCGRMPAIRINAHWQQGMAGSLLCGLRAIPRTSTGVLVLVCDQPAVTAIALGRLMRAWQRHPAWPAAAFYAGHPGVPAILPAASFRSLRSLRGDAGAREILRKAAHLTTVAMPAAAIDIDEAADLERIGAAAP